MASKSDEIWGKVREAWRFTVHWLRTFRDANGLMNSAAMAFFAMLSLVPFLVVSAGAVELFTDTAPDEALKELPSYGSASGLMGYFLPFVSTYMSYFRNFQIKLLLYNGIHMKFKV